MDAIWGKSFFCLVQLMMMLERNIVKAMNGVGWMRMSLKMTQDLYARFAVRNIGGSFVVLMLLESIVSLGKGFFLCLCCHSFNSNSNTRLGIG